MSETDGREHSELATFGEELRKEREIRGISLKEIADATKVSRRFLEAIERNDHSTLPAPVFTRGFVREYARYLGLNAEEMVDRYNFAAAGDDRIEKTPHLDRIADGTIAREPAVTERAARPRKNIPQAYTRIDRNIVALILVSAALGALIYWLLGHKRDLRNEEVAKPVAVVRKPVSSSTAPTVPATASAAVTAATVPPASDGLLHLTLDFSEKTWVALEADGKAVLTDEVGKGEQLKFEAHDNFHFKTIGNAAGVVLTLDGVQLPRSGEPGEVIHDKVIDHNTLHPAAASAPAAPRTTS